MDLFIKERISHKLGYDTFESLERMLKQSHLGNRRARHNLKAQLKFYEGYEELIKGGGLDDK